MRKRILMGAAGAVLLIAGFVGGMFATGGIPAFAATNTGNTANAVTAGTTRGNYCQTYINTLASDLGVSTSKLQSANADAIQKALDQMQQDGTITSSQKAKIEQRLKTAEQHPCEALKGLVAAGPGRAGKAGKLGAALSTARQQIEMAVAGALNISPTTLQQDLAQGQTITQIAASQHIAVSTVNTAYINAVTSALSSAQSNGLLTQQQATTVLDQIQQAVNAGHYPGLEMHGPKGAGAPPSAPPAANA